jgi:elongation factor P--beta-lysine ligase
MQPRTTESIRELIDEARVRFEDSPTEADAWLAPRLHAELRLTRAEAADNGLWNHLALRIAPEYVFFRHLGQPTARKNVPKVSRNRFVGAYHTQAFARLWWAAELFRDGYDYKPAVAACGNQDVLNTVLRMTFVLHRPAAQALLRLVVAGEAGQGREANALAKAVNAVASTVSFEAIAPDADPDTEAHRLWVQNREDELVPLDSLPDGPDDGRAPLESVNRLEDMFRRVYTEAPVRGRVTVTASG